MAPSLVLHTSSAKTLLLPPPVLHIDNKTSIKKKAHNTPGGMEGGRRETCKQKQCWDAAVYGGVHARRGGAGRSHDGWREGGRERPTGSQQPQHTGRGGQGRAGRARQARSCRGEAAVPTHTLPVYLITLGSCSPPSVPSACSLRFRWRPGRKSSCRVAAVLVVVVVVS